VSTSWFRSLSAAMFALLLVPASPKQTCDSPNAGPFRDTPDATDAKLMLMGHDPVAYFTQSAAVKGAPFIKNEHLGTT